MSCRSALSLTWSPTATANTWTPAARAAAASNSSWALLTMSRQSVSSKATFRAPPRSPFRAESRAPNRAEFHKISEAVADLHEQILDVRLWVQFSSFYMRFSGKFGQKIGWRTLGVDAPTAISWVRHCGRLILIQVCILTCKHVGPEELKGSRHVTVAARVRQLLYPVAQPHPVGVLVESDREFG